jgi:hypothetical protein
MTIATSHVPNVSAAALNQIVRLIAGLPGGPIGFRDSVENWMSSINSLYEQGSVAVTVANETGGPLATGDLVYISAYDAPSGYPEVALADANTIGKPGMYVLLADIATGSQGQAAQVVTLDGIDTSGVLEDDLLYLSSTATTGNTWTKTAPTGAGVQQQIVGMVETVSATNGRIRFDLAASSAQRQEADRILIADAGSLFVAAEVEAALQELRTTMVSKAVADATVAGGVATVVQAFQTIRGQGAAADDVDTVTGLAASGIGYFVTGAEAITYRDFAVGGGNISTPRNSSIVTATGDVVKAVRSGAAVYITPVMIQAGYPGALLGPAATADLLVMLAADQITNAVLIQAILDGAFQADAATRALFAAKCLTENKITGTAAQAIVPAAATATLTGIGLYAMDDGAGAFNLDTLAGLDDGEWAFLTISNIANPITIRDNSVGGGNIWTHRAQSLVLAALADMVLVRRDGARYVVVASSIQAGQATGSGTAATTSSSIRLQQTTEPLAAAGTNYVAQYAGGAALNDAGPFTRFIPARTAQIVLGGGAPATVVYTIDGTDPDGAALQEVISSGGAGAGTYTGTRAFTTITNITSDIDPVGTTDLQTGAGFGLGAVCANIDGVGVAGVFEAPVSAHGPTGTVIPTTAPNGVIVYTVQYRVTPVITDGGHTHLA